MTYIISQVLVCIADVLYVVSMLTKKKISLVMFLLFSDILFASHYLLLEGGLTGAATILVDVVYLVIMYLLEKYNKTKFNLLTTIIAIAVTIILSILTWETALSLLPMFSMLIYLFTMIFKNLVIVKSGALVRNTLNVIYMFLIASYFGAGLEIALMGSAIVGIIINWKHNKNKQSVFNEPIKETSSASLDTTNSETPQNTTTEIEKKSEEIQIKNETPNKKTSKPKSDKKID